MFNLFGLGTDVGGLDVNTKGLGDAVIVCGEGGLCDAEGLDISVSGVRMRILGSYR